MADLPKPSVGELDRLEEELARLRAFRSRLAAGDDRGREEIDIAMASAQHALRRQAEALELHREKTLLRMQIDRLEARLVEIDEAEGDPGKQLHYLGGPTDPTRVRSQLRALRARLALITEEGEL